MPSATNELAGTSHCWSCKTEIDPTDRFCPHCGAKVFGSSVGGSIKCPACYKPISSQAEFCPNCGASVARAAVAATTPWPGSSSTADASDLKEKPKEQGPSTSAITEPERITDDRAPESKNASDKDANVKNRLPDRPVDDYANGSVSISLEETILRRFVGERSLNLL